MRASSIVVALSALGFTSAHTVFDRFFVDGVDQGAGTCLRIKPEYDNRNAPISPNAKEMACGRSGETAVDRICPIKAGAKVTFSWETNSKREDGHLADSHLGPCSIMMKKVSSMKDPAAGDGWFRIFYEGFNTGTGQWCTQRMMKDGFLTVTLPADIEGGYYYLRPELLALHSAANGDPQFYVGCAQVFLDSAGTARPSDTVAIPSDEYAKPGSPAMSFNYYYPKGRESTYPNYGPPTYKGTGQPSGGSSIKQTEGLRPADCILATNNWCGKEVSKYNDQDGCWAASKECWDISGTCWKSVAIDSSACKIYAEKCDRIGKQCEAKNWNGPPDHGKDLTPPPLTPNLPPSVTDGGVITGGTSNNGSSSSAPSSSSTAAGGSGYDSSSSSALASPSTTAVANAGSGYDASPSATTSPLINDSGAPKKKYANGDDENTSSAVSPGSSSETSTTKTTPTPTAGPSECVEAVTETVMATATVTVQPKPGGYRK